MITEVLSDHIRRLEELRQNAAYVRKLFAIAQGAMSPEEKRNRFRGESGSLIAYPDERKRFYAADEFHFSDSSIALGVLVQGDSEMLEYLNFRMYTPSVALIYNIFGKEPPLRTYRIIGRLVHEEKLVGMVLDDFSAPTKVQVEKELYLEDLFGYTGGLYFPFGSGMVAGDFDKVHPTERYYTRFNELQQSVIDNEHLFTIQKPSS